MDDRKLIKLVHSYPYLYDRKRSDFKDLRKKKTSWEEIAKLLKYSVTDVQNRWRYLREKYSREKNVQNLPSGSGAPQKPRWEYFDALSWLDPYMRKRATKYIYENEESEAQEVEPESENFIIPMVKVESQILSESDPLSSSSLSLPERNADMPRAASPTPQWESIPRRSIYKKRTISEVDQAQISSSINETGQTMQGAVEVFKGQRAQKDFEDDEDELFGKMVVSCLKKRKNTKRKNELKKTIFSQLMEMSDSE